MPFFSVFGKRYDSFKAALAIAQLIADSSRELVPIVTDQVVLKMVSPRENPEKSSASATTGSLRSPERQMKRDVFHA